MRWSCRVAVAVLAGLPIAASLPLASRASAQDVPAEKPKGVPIATLVRYEYVPAGPLPDVKRVGSSTSSRRPR